VAVAEESRTSSILGHASRVTPAEPVRKGEFVLQPAAPRSRPPYPTQHVQPGSRHGENRSSSYSMSPRGQRVPIERGAQQWTPTSLPLLDSRNVIALPTC